MNGYLIDTNVLSWLLYENNIPEKLLKYWNQIQNKQSRLILIAPVVSEIFYKNAPNIGDEKTEYEIWKLVNSLNPKLYSLGYNDAIKAGAIKIKYSGRKKDELSLVDCFLLAVAKRYKTSIITTDHSIDNIGRNMNIDVRYLPFVSLSKKIS